MTGGGDAAIDLSQWDGVGSDGGTIEQPDGVVDVGDAPAPGEFLAPCEGNEDCFSGYCVESADGKVCSKNCEDETSCPNGWSCEQLSQGGDPSYICISRDTFLCRPCQEDGDCNTPGLPQTGHCVQVGPHGLFCTRLCDDALSCPDPFTCEFQQPYGVDGPTLQMCVTDVLSTCECTPAFVTQNATTSCYQENEHGRCYGESACVEEGPLGSCTALVPSVEICNGHDDDCDGEVDEEAEGCVMYYEDMDGDGWGFGYGQCVCEQPDVGWVTQGGDCNEFVASINPGIEEGCNGMDDDCDGFTDEEDSIFCINQYPDGDGDGYGVDTETSCQCAGLPGWAPEIGDCDDVIAEVNPGALESCNAVDDDCDGAVDEVDADGCIPYFLDQDDDGYGLSEIVKCLCEPTGDYVGGIPGDCDDLTEAVHPGLAELCNGVDDNCDGETDEGDDALLCPLVAHGTAGCVEGTCALVDCEADWSDADGDPLNGCECSVGELEAPGALGQSCAEPMDLGVLLDDGSSGQVETTDNVAPEGDEDWYTFTAIDGADPDSCDSFSVSVELVHNPQEQFAFDVFAGGCEASKEICKQVTHFTDTTSLNEIVDGAMIGECPCTAEPDTDVSSTQEGVQKCADQTMVFRVRVYRREGLPLSCAAYTLRIQNGP